MPKLNDPKFAAVVSHFERACKASRDHVKLASESLERFGDHGSLISGVVRDHFDDQTKDRLRDLALEVTRQSDLAHAARPRYVRLMTIIQIGNLVARRDGSGYYGPRG